MQVYLMDLPHNFCPSSPIPSFEKQKMLAKAKNKP
jgi:hypothetical protein